VLKAIVPRAGRAASVPALFRRSRRLSVEENTLRYFPTFATLVAKVTETLTKFAGLPNELTVLVGEYRELTPLAA
jgi:hypothetical protein